LPPSSLAPTSLVLFQPKPTLLQFGEDNTNEPTAKPASGEAEQPEAEQEGSRE